MLVKVKKNSDFQVRAFFNGKFLDVKDSPYFMCSKDFFLLDTVVIAVPTVKEPFLGGEDVPL